MVDLKIPQSEWLRAFWPISQEHFSQLELFSIRRLVVI